jgi:hypothetical protein
MTETNFKIEYYEGEGEDTWVDTDGDYGTLADANDAAEKGLRTNPNYHHAVISRVKTTALHRVLLTAVHEEA